MHCLRIFLFIVFPAAMASDMIDIVVLNGTCSIQEQYPREQITKENGWEDCPVPSMLGIPLMAKPMRPYPSGRVPQQQFAVFMMVEPNSGLAPPNWQLGPYCNRGMIGICNLTIVYSLSDLLNLYFVFH